MDEETKQFIEEVRVKYRGNKDIELLLLEFANLEMKLIGADVMAMMVDIAVRRGGIDERGIIADARLNYGMPWEYEFADEKLLSEYKGGIEEVKEVFAKRKNVKKIL
jgi:hypothetical protein